MFQTAWLSRTGRLKTEYRLIVLQYSGRLKPCTATANPLFMIYQRNFIKELSFTAVGIFVVLLAILVSTQAINLLGRAADGRVAIDAVVALVGFWIIGMTPLLLVLTAYISTLTVLTRYWRDSEMSVWLSCGLALKQWVRPVLQFAVPFAVLTAIIQLSVLPWAELRSREFAEILKQKQQLSLVEAGVFRNLGSRDDRVLAEVEQAVSIDVGKGSALRRAQRRELRTATRQQPQRHRNTSHLLKGTAAQALASRHRRGKIHLPLCPPCSLLLIVKPRF